MKQWTMSIALCAMMFAPCVATPASAAAGTINTRGFTIDYSGIPKSTALKVADVAEQALSDVTGFLHMARPAQQIHIKISEKFPFPRAYPQKLLMQLPANRFGKAGAPTGPKAIRGRGPTFWHGIANVLAPSAHPTEGWGRFLTEGLGAYLESKFGAKRQSKYDVPWPAKVYPAMGGSLNAGTLALEGKMGPMSMEEAMRRVNERMLTRPRQLAWLQAGSFVGFLIETRGLDAFLKWYRGQTFHESYGTTLEDVERQWRSYIAEDRS